METSIPSCSHYCSHLLQTLFSALWWKLDTPRWRQPRTSTSSIWLLPTPWPPARCPSRAPSTSWTPGRLGKSCASSLSPSTTTTCSQASSPSPWWAWTATLLCATQSGLWNFERRSRPRWSTCSSGFCRLRSGFPLWSWLWPKLQIVVR